MSIEHKSFTLVKKKNLLIIGAGGHGRVAYDIALKMKSWQRIVFLDKKVESSMGLAVIRESSEKALKYSGNHDFFIAIGNNDRRELVQERLLLEGANIVTLIHPGAILGSQVELGMGTVVMAGAIVNCCSRIGMGCIINTAATIDHDNEIMDYAHIVPGSCLAGSVKVGEKSCIGIGAIVSNNLSIAANCFIGAGAVVVSNLEVPGTYLGSPARRSDHE